MKNTKHDKSLSLRSVFRLCLRHFTLAILATIVLSGCGSGGGGGSGGSGTSNQPTTTNASLIIAAVNDASVPVIAVATDGYGTEAIEVFVEKDETGKPIRLAAVHYVASGAAGNVEIGSDGFPSVFSDEVGNKLIFSNYTATTVDVTFIDHEGNQIIGPYTIEVDATKLAELKSTYAAALQGSVASQNQVVSGVQTLSAAYVASSSFEDVARWENSKLWLKTAALFVDWGICGAKVYAAVQTFGALAPVAAAGCASAVVSTATHIGGVEEIGVDAALFGWDATLNCVAKFSPGSCAYTLSNLIPPESLDVFPPTKPLGLTKLSLTYNKVSIGWQASYDAYGVRGYRIYRDDVQVGSDASAFFMDQNVSPGARYCYQAEAYDVGGNSSGKSDPLCVTTTTAPQPIAVTGAATNITPSSSTLNGSVNPNGLATEVFFEYGTSTPYQSETSRQPVGSGTASVSVSPVTINGLASGATYHYRLVAINSEGSANYGSDQTFRAATPVILGPIITGVSPDPVSGSNNAQLFTMNGSNFVSGANITLREKSTGEVFPNRVASSFSSTQIVIKPIFTTVAATWSVSVINPDGSSTGEYVFQVVAPADTTTFSITPGSASVNEGSGVATFTVTRSSGAVAQTVYVSTTQSEGYSNSSDYSGITNQALSFAVGETSKTVTVPITNDVVVEPDEVFGLIVQQNSSDPVTTYLAKATFTIVNDDIATTAPDLQVLYGSAVSSSGLVTAIWTLSNQGTAMANTSTTVVHINQSSTSAAGSNLASISAPSLAAGGSTPQNATMPAPTTAGTYYVWVLADNYSTSGQTASAVANDIVQIGSFTVGTPPSAAPVVTSINPTTMTANGAAQVLGIIGNNFQNGNLVQFKWGVGVGAGVWNNATGAVSVISANLISVNMNPGTVNDTIYVRVCRSASQTTTADCSSGTQAVTVTAVVTTPPDLVTQNLTISPTSGATGSTATVSFTIRNQGSGTAAANTANVRINASASDVTTSDPLLASINVPSLAPGATYAVSQPVTIPAGRPSGTNYVWVILDVNSTAGQGTANEANDRSYVSYTVSVSFSKEVTVANLSGGLLMLRSGPGQSYSIITTLPEGTKMGVIGGPILADGYTWWNISGTNGTGWSAVGDWFTPQPQIGATVTVSYTGGAGLRLRSTASLSGVIITTLPEGTQVNVFSGPIQANGYTWWAVQGYVGGTQYTGWSAVGDWLTPNPRY